MNINSHRPSKIKDDDRLHRTSVLHKRPIMSLHNRDSLLSHGRNRETEQQVAEMYLPRMHNKGEVD
jgi:hypothetical protein